MKINPGWRPLGQDRTRTDQGQNGAAAEFRRYHEHQDEQQIDGAAAEKLQDIHNKESAFALDDGT